jgi:hypothetical protein
VNPNTQPSFTQVLGICTGETLLPLPTTSNNGLTGTWSPALNNTTTTTYTFTPSGGQCGTTATMTISVNPNITPSFNPIPDICAGASLSPLPTTSNNGITGTWTPALNNSATTTYTFSPNGGQCATPASTTIEVNTNPSATLIFDGASLLAGAGFAAYTWTLDGITIPEANTNELSVSEVGLYTVIVTDANGCTATAQFEVITVGLADLGLTDAIAIYPNPSHGNATLSIQFQEGQQVNLFILDLQGKILFQQNYTFKSGKNEVLLDLSSLADGVYFIQLENSNFKHTRRLVKLEN